MCDGSGSQKRFTREFGMRIGWLEFESEVGPFLAIGTAAECKERLGHIVGAPGRTEKTKPYLGRMTDAGGSIWKRMVFVNIVPARVVSFQFTSEADRVRFDGRIPLRPALRIPVSIYLAFCCVAFLISVFESVREHNLWPVLGPVLGFLMVFGWTCAAVYFNRREERTMVAAIEQAMQDDRAALLLGKVLARG